MVIEMVGVRFLFVMGDFDIIYYGIYFWGWERSKLYWEVVWSIFSNMESVCRDI